MALASFSRGMGFFSSMTTPVFARGSSIVTVFLVSLVEKQPAMSTRLRTNIPKINLHKFPLMVVLT